MAKFKPTDERQGYRDQLANLTELALNLAGNRCELALQAGELQQQVMGLTEQIDKIGKELMKLGAEEMSVHQKRRQLARLLLSGDSHDMDVV